MSDTASRVLLDCAAFMDSTQAGTLDGTSETVRREVVQMFLQSCYDEIGKAPKLLDREDLHAILCHLLPARFGRKDPRAGQVGPILRAWLEFLVANDVVPNEFELRAALDGDLAEFERIVRTGAGHVHGVPHAPQKPFVHKGTKVGRNDPCPCGSGKKFKQCCAKLGR
jgi:hypothetical protein